MPDGTYNSERVLAIEASLALYERSLEAARIGSWRAGVGPESILELTAESSLILGVAPGSTLRNFDFYQMLYPEDRDRLIETIMLVRSDQIRRCLEVRLIRENGADCVLQIVAAPSSTEGVVIGTMADITDRAGAAAHTERERRRSMERELRRALDRDELFLEYQPIIELESGRYIGAEALVRWEHPDRGRLEPGEFIGFAEQTGLILPLGKWVLENACRELRRWQDDGLPADLVMSVNLSAVQLRTEGLPSAVQGALASSGVPGSSVLLEVTESVLVEGSLDERSLREIRDLDVRIAIDDFGTKYSTLSYLARLPVDALKIDAVFIRDIDGEPGRAIVAAVAALGHALGLSVTAEGIETEDQLDAVRAVGCDAAQGFLIAAPLSAEECLAVLHQTVLTGPQA